MGGDEFVVLLPETFADDARMVLEKIRRCVAEDPDFSECTVTISIGAVSFARSPSEIGPMVKAADDIMYNAKNSGKNQILIEEIQHPAS